jgi:hypothetical protein
MKSVEVESGAYISYKRYKDWKNSKFMVHRVSSVLNYKWKSSNNRVTQNVEDKHQEKKFVNTD